ncbi:MAG: hypothetical protein Q4D56_08190 [Bacteroides sp.]|nr:hypothetical protein [Bacteroides sp.]
MKPNAQIIITIYLLFFLVACSPLKEAKEQADSLPEIYPDYTSAAIPCNIAPLNFGVEGVQHIQAAFSVEGDRQLVVKGKADVQIPLKKWRKLLDAAKGKQLEVTVSVWDDNHPDGLRYQPFTLYVAPEPIDSHIAYRLIEPGYEGWNVMGIYQRDLTSFEEKAIATNRKDKTRCMNCHEFNHYSPREFLFHVRGEGGGTALYDGNTIRKIAFDRQPPYINASLPAWHPRGRYIAFASSTSRQVFFSEGEQALEAFSTRGDLMIYDRQTNRLLTDERFVGERAWEDFPAWSADGKFLYFCVARPQELPQAYKQVRYNLCRVGFDEQTGQLQAKVDTLYDADKQGGSVVFPTESPDGRYLLYTKSAYGSFPIFWHNEARLEMIRLTDGQQVDTSVWDSERSESYHAWSSNSRWVLISSRRVDGNYTRVFIAYMDEVGRLYKPFMLPQRKPKDDVLRLKSYNLPKFVQGEVTLPRGQLDALFFSTARTKR